MKITEMRACLMQLTDGDVRDLMDFSSGLRSAILRDLKKPQSSVINRAAFRTWLMNPGTSDKTLQKMSDRLPREILKRIEAGESIDGYPSVVAMGKIAERPKATPAVFKELLDQARASPITAEMQSDASIDHAASHSVRPSDDDAVAVLSGVATDLASSLESALDDIRQGRRCGQSLAEIEAEWADARADAWAGAGLDEVPDAAGFAELTDALAHRARELEAETIAAQQAAQAEAVDRLRAEVAELDESLPALKQMAARQGVFEQAYTQALEEKSAIEVRLAEMLAGLDLAEPAADIEEGPADHVAPESSETAETEDQDETEEEGNPFGGPDSASLDYPPTQTHQSELAPATESAALQVEIPAPDSPDPVDPVLPSPAATTVMDQRPVVLGAENVANTEENLGAGDSPKSAETGTLPETEPGENDIIESIDPDDLAHITRHIENRRYGAAWLTALALYRPAVEVRFYELAAGAFHSAAGMVDPSGVLSDITTAVSESEKLSPQIARLALASTLRCGLAAGWIPRSEVDSLARSAALDEPWRDLQLAAVDAAERNYQHQQGAVFAPNDGDIRARARAERVRLKEKTRTKFVRADKVLMYLMRKQQPLGMALDAVEAPTDGEPRREALTEVLASLRSPGDLIARADAAQSSQVQLRTDIIKGARATLEKSIESVEDLVRDAINAVVTTTNDSHAALAQEVGTNLLAVTDALLGQAHAIDGPGDRALLNLLAWIREPVLNPVSSVEELLLAESLPAVTANRRPDGLPAAVQPEAPAVIKELAAPRAKSELFEAYIARGDLQQASVIADEDPDLASRLSSERDRLTRRLRAEVADIRAEVGHTYAYEIDSAAQSAAEARLVEPEGYTGDRFDLALADLASLRETLAEHRRQAAEAIRSSARVQVSRDSDVKRIEALVDRGDLVAANELFSLALAGPLPEETTDANAELGAALFSDFTDRLAALAASGVASMRHIVETLGPDERGTRLPADQTFDDWRELVARRTPESKFNSVLTSVMRQLGLDRTQPVTRTRAKGSGHAISRFTARPYDGSLVPALGSQPRHYHVAVTGDADELIRQVLPAGFPESNGPNIVLFAGILTMDQRRLCLRVCRSNAVSALVVDQAVAGYVMSRRRRSFIAVQQLTLPFTCFSHYTLISGHVPDEVFVGRSGEQRDLMARDRSLFVYGGRQLGKTALLKRTAREFSSVEEQHAIYIDLNVHGIGRWTESHQIWQVIYNELAKIESMNLRPSSTIAKPDPVQKAVLLWLRGSDSRRLLVLLDEADAFLEKESVSDVNGFRNIQPLKGLFEETTGRFKPVFAGLHRVQRLQNVSNTPLAHGGRDTLIGPLSPAPAHDLVVRPLEALGYRFENPDLVWRLLAFTNMQPGLIQLVCDQLVKQLQGRTLRRDEPLIVITSDDVDTVTQNANTRNAIADKLRLTIDLEVRYRVIALTVAIMCMEDGFRQRYSVEDIKLHCEDRWAEGFEELSTTEFASHLDELIDLGVLTKDSLDSYSVRSPNIVTMLGSREQLMTELSEAEFELEPEYNPRSTRRQVHEGGTSFRSPLTENDLSDLLPRRSIHDCLTFVVVGTQALNVGRVIPTLLSVAQERRIGLDVIDGNEISAESRIKGFSFPKRGNKEPRVLAVDATSSDEATVRELLIAVRSLSQRTHGHVVLVVGDRGLVSVASPDLDRNERLLLLEKWSGDGIRSWQDNPFRSDPGDRRALLLATGGWPDLVDRAVESADSGLGNKQVISVLDSYPGSRAEAEEFLDLVGVRSREAVRLLAGWAEFGLTEHEPAADIAEVLDEEPAAAESLLHRLSLVGVVDERGGEYLLDPVVSRALLADK